MRLEKLPCQECQRPADRQVWFTNWYASWPKGEVKRYYIICKECLERVNANLQPAQNLGYLSIIIKDYKGGQPVEFI